MRNWKLVFFAIIIGWIIWQCTNPGIGKAGIVPQIPTGSIATVTGTVTGPVVSVRIDIDQPQINVRSGPGTNYEKVGVMLLGQKAVAKGRSPGGDWILIDYPGVSGGQAWVYAPLVNITPGELKVIALPPTPTALVTITIDPTMAAQFVITLAPTRLPTYTPAPALVIPTYANESGTDAQTGIPMGIVILGLGAIGLFLGLFAIAQGR